MGVPYKENESGAPVEAVASKLREIFDASMLDTGLEKGVPPVLYMENGRFLTGPAGYLVARCHAVCSVLTCAGVTMTFEDAT